MGWLVRVCWYGHCDWKTSPHLVRTDLELLSMGLATVTLPGLPLQHHIKAFVRKFCNPLIQMNRHTRPQRTPVTVTSFPKHRQHRFGETQCMCSTGYQSPCGSGWREGKQHIIYSRQLWSEVNTSSTGSKVPWLLIFSREGNGRLSQKSVNIEKLVFLVQVPSSHEWSLYSTDIWKYWESRKKMLTGIKKRNVF